MPTDKIQFDNKAKSTIFGRASIVFFCVLIIGILIIYKIIDIQYVRGDELRSHTFDYEYKYVDITGIRGNIYSEDGMVLATSIPVYDVYLDLNEKNVSKEIFDKDYFAGLPVDYRKVSVRIKTCGPAAEPKTKSTPSPSTSASTPPSTPPPPKPRYIYKPFNSLAEKVLF